MGLKSLILFSAFLLILSVAPTYAQIVEVRTSQVVIAKRGTLAIKYPESDGTSVDLIGTALLPRAGGKAEVKRKEGRTRISIELDHIENPQSLGAYYTTYVIWAIAPEGQADNIGELPLDGGKSKIEVTTPYQTFGLIMTAEPHGMVKLPSPAIVVENVLRDKTKGSITSSQIEYRGDSGVYYVVKDSIAADYATPLVILGARRSVDIARRAGASQYAQEELRQADIKLTALEALWAHHRKHEKIYAGEARDVMRLGELARSLAVERAEQARLDAERDAASQAIARSEAEAERAKLEANSYRAALAHSENELAAARKRAEEAQSEADRAKANEEVARLEAERQRLEKEEANRTAAEAQRESEQAKRERDALQQRLFVSIAAILDTKREARGLIVNLSDVLFDFNKATLKPGAREKLSKLAGILLAYPGEYHMEIEGHTDSVGSDDYNQKLSEDRAASVRDYLAQAGIPSVKILAVRGFGKTRPVTTNDTPEGRQMNRRVEIIIADQETLSPSSLNRQ